MNKEKFNYGVGADDPVRPHFEGITREKFHRGITLIALVITIIVLLILAGVAISLAVDSGGLFAKANQAGQEWNSAIDQEQTDLAGIMVMLNSLGGGQAGDGDETPTNPDPEAPELPEGWDSSVVGSIVTETSALHEGEQAKERIAPIPVGYTVSGITEEVNEDNPENTIAGGLVIYQIPNGATVVWEDNLITLPGESTAINLQENVNQYVWIPVDDINDMVMCKKNGQAGVEGATTTTCDLEYSTTTGHITCNTHGYSTTTELTTGEGGNIDTTGLAGRLYATSSTDSDGDKIYQTSMTFTDANKDAHSFTVDSGYREPDLVRNYDKDSNSSYLELAGVSSKLANDFKVQLNDDFIAMAKSVAKYGGFYIARYEAGLNGASKKNQLVLTASTSASGNYLAGTRWYGLYGTLRDNEEVEKAEGSRIINTSVVNSHMVWRKYV